MLNIILPIVTLWCLIQVLCALVVFFFGKEQELVEETDKRLSRSSGGWVQVAYLVIALALSYLAARLAQKKAKSVIQDDAPTVLATRGSFASRLKGRDRMGFVFAWAGNRQKRKEKGGKKGSTFAGGQKQEIWYESGWHILHDGEVFALHRITSGGETIFQGPITINSHPSGSTIDLGREGSFQIFWGEDNQPLATFLGAAGRVGITSRWPRMCHIIWLERRLGGAPQWEQMDYTFETRPKSAILTQTVGYIEPTYTLLVDPVQVTEANDGPSGVGYFKIGGDVSSKYPPLTKIRVSGDTGLGMDVDYKVLFADVVVISDDPETEMVNEYELNTFVYVEETITGAAGDGEINPFESAKDDGWNPAHIIAEILFEQRPDGLELDQSQWDMESLEQLGLLAEEEDLRCTVKGIDGQDVRSVLGGIMQDVGFLLPTHPETGLLTFMPIRKPTGDIKHLSFDMFTELAEHEVPHGERATDRFSFSFSNEMNNFRADPIAIPDDGQAIFLSYVNAREVQIISTRNFNTAAKIASRRSREEMASPAAFTIHANRAARILIPGEAITADGFPFVLRVTEVECDPLSGDCEVTVITDVMGARLSDFRRADGNFGGGGNPAAQDIDFGVVELPELISGPQQMVLVPFVRAHAGILTHAMHLSRDDVGYTLMGSDSSILTGGTLVAALSSNSEMHLDLGPVISAKGPDISDVLDLSADETSWLRGRQMAVAINSTGRAEIMFLKKITSVGGGNYRLDGLVRARFDTQMLSFASGTMIYIVQDDEGLPITDVLLEPSVTIFAKSQPIGQGAVPLTNIAARFAPLYGKGVRPLPVKNIGFDLGSEEEGPGSYLRHGNSYYLTGSAPDDDIDFNWSYYTPQSASAGAGMSGAGAPFIDPDPEGPFLLQVLDSMDVLIRTETISGASWTYTRADRMADFSGEPASFKIRILQTRGGQNSDATTETFTQG